MWLQCFEAKSETESEKGTVDVLKKAHVVLKNKFNIIYVLPKRIAHQVIQTLSIEHKRCKTLFNVQFNFICDIYFGSTLVH